ncbi:MAG: hypothetical protein RLZZ369_789 [Pseudomonadota bacterium]
MDNSLTMSLAILGGTVLAAFVAHSAWTSRKLAKLQPKRAGLEPLGDDPDLSMADTIPTEINGDDTQPSPLPLPKRGGAKLDALIDAIATINIESPLSGNMILAHLPSTRRAGSKPLLVEGLRTDCGEWEFPQAGVTYSELQAGVLLANRTGALNEIEYSVARLCSPTCWMWLPTPKSWTTLLARMTRNWPCVCMRVAVLGR